jgi:hypothetical protein
MHHRSINPAILKQIWDGAQTSEFLMFPTNSCIWPSSCASEGQLGLIPGHSMNTKICDAQIPYVKWFSIYI